MKRSVVLIALVLSAIALAMPSGAAIAQATQGISLAKPGRDPKQPIDSEYTKKIKEYTTETWFGSPLVDYLPASKTVPTPKIVLGDIAGAPGKLPYSKEVYDYMRMLAKAAPNRVKVYSIGTTEEGREMIAVAVASDKLMANYDKNRAQMAKLADPRTINMNDADAEKIINEVAPVYYITGTIHSSEAGAPTALMELAYRLAVDDSPYIKHIRDNVITLITPIVEVDGRDRQVDVYNWTKKHPNETAPSLIYWGHYVAHDNNRDAMGLTLKLSQNVLNAYVDHQAMVLHDLHESVALLYDNTIGDGPFNAWIDPLLANEWQMIGWNNVQEMTRMGMPGVFAHGTFDTWSPGYLMFIAAMHNGISRLYETFGNGGSADTRERTLTGADINRTWYRQNPAPARFMWSLRNNNNYEQTGLLVSLFYMANNKHLFLQNFYEKSKRSIQKAHTEGPAAWVLSADDPRLGSQAELLRVLQKQKVEISRATAAFTVSLPRRGAAAAAAGAAGGGRGGRGGGGAGGGGAAGAAGGAGGAAGGAAGAGGGRGGRGGRGAPPDANAAAVPPAPAAETKTFPAGSYIVRMDQPYSRIADALLDYQYWAPNDPQTRPYDDTGWTFPEGFGVQATRITDTTVLHAPMQKVSGDVQSQGGVAGSGPVYAINANADNGLVQLRYRLKDADIQAAEESFESGGTKFNAGSFVIRGVPAATIDATTKELGLKTYAIGAAPTVKMHPVRAARVAIVHAWSNTQTEGWWRLAFDANKIPFDYISAPDIGKTASLASRWDVIIFPPGSASEQSTIDGMPMWKNPIPWKTSDETPNIGKFAETDDIRPGMGMEGMIHLRDFVKNGGVLIGAMSTPQFLISIGLTNGVSTAATPRREVDGSLLRTRLVDTGSPLAYGIIDSLAVFSNDGASFGVNNTPGGRAGGAGGRGGAGGGRGGAAAGRGGPTRPTGSGRADDQDVVQGRPPLIGHIDPPQRGTTADSSADPNGRGGGAGNLNTLPPELRPRTILRYTDQTRDLLVSGLLDGGEDIVGRPNLVDSQYEKGHVVMFSFNPMYRGETIGSYGFVFNAIMHWDNLSAGRKP